MSFVPEIVTKPNGYALTLTEAKDHLELDHDDQDDLVEALIQTAQDHLDGPDGVLSRTLMDTEWRFTQELFGTDCVHIKSQGVRSAQASLDGDALTGTLRQLDTGFALLQLDAAVTGEVEVTYRDGAEQAKDVPAALRHAMKLHIGSLYEHREMELPGVSVTELPHYKSLINPYRKRRIG